MYNTRFVTKGKLTTCSINIYTYEFRSFKHQGTHILNGLNDFNFTLITNLKDVFFQ